MTEAAGLRLLHLNASAGYGGGEHQTWLLVTELERLGVENHVLARRGSRLAARLARELPAGRVHLLPPFAVSLTLPLASAWLAWRLGVTHLHAHTGRATLGFLLAGRVFRVAHRRIPDLPRHDGLRRLRGADAVLCISAEIARRLAATGLGAGGKPRLETVHSSVEELERTSLRPAILAGSPVLGFLGHFRRHKGLDLLLRALPALLPAHPGLVLHLVGGGVEETSLRALAAELKLGDAVRFHPFTDQPLETMAALDLFVMPSREEGMGSVALQAQALGIPVLATTAGGIAEGVAHGLTGWLVEPESVPALAEGLRRLLDDAAWRRSLGEAGPAWVREHFSAALMAHRTLSIDLALRRDREGA